MNTPPNFSSPLELLADAVIQTDGHWTISYLNSAWYTLTNRRPEQSLSRPFFDFVHADDHAALRAGITQFRLLRADGSFVWVSWRVNVECDANGYALRRTGTLRELSESTERSVADDRQRFLRLLETIDGVVWEAERGVGNTFLSAQTQRLFGYTVEEWRADPKFWRNHVHPDDFPAALAIDEAAYNATHSYAYEMNYRFFAKSGTVLWVRDLCRAIVEPGQPTRLIGLMINVSQQKQTELALQESKERYALATRGSNDGIWDWDLANDVLHCSERFCEIVGLGTVERSEKDGWSFLKQFIDPDDVERVLGAYHRHLNGQSPSLSVDFRVRRSAKQSMWVNWRGLVHFESAVPVRAAGSLTDLAQRGSFYDPLTDLPGRPLFRDRLEQAIAQFQLATTKPNALNEPKRRRGDANLFAVLLLDLNRFKSVNDELGHLVGDALLQQVAQRLRSCIRNADLVARMSGDEFVVLLESAEIDDALQRAHAIAEALAEPFDVLARSVKTSASIGVACSQTSLSTVDDYLDAADSAMYESKRNGQHVTVFAP